MVYQMKRCSAIPDHEIVLYNEEFRAAGEECYVLWLLDLHGIRWWKENVAGDERSRHYGFYAGGELAGICRITYPLNYAANGMVGIGIRPSLRGRGLAKEMIRLITCICIEEGIQMPTACIDVRNWKSTLAFRRTGWSETGKQYDWEGGRIANEFAIDLRQYATGKQCSI